MVLLHHVGHAICAAPCTRSEPASTPATPPAGFSRRAALASALLTACITPPMATAAPIPPAPPVGNCPECLGEVDDALNRCNFDAPSCVSVYNDDEEHFFAPWSFDIPPQAAADQLVQVATGATQIEGPRQVRRADAATYILGGTAAVMTGKDLPDKPTRAGTSRTVRFNAQLQERYTTPRGSEYVRLTFMPENAKTEGDASVDPADVIDAEFMFLTGDRIVNVRASSRAQPTARQGRFQLSLENGIVFDRNRARQRMEGLRQALGWEITPVVADFLPQYNRKKPTIAEKVFEPFKYQYEPPANTDLSNDVHAFHVDMLENHK